MGKLNDEKQRMSKAVFHHSKYNKAEIQFYRESSFCAYFITNRVHFVNGIRSVYLNLLWCDLFPGAFDLDLYPVECCFFFDDTCSLLVPPVVVISFGFFFCLNSALKSILCACCCCFFWEDASLMSDEPSILLLPCWLSVIRWGKQKLNHCLKAKTITY